MCCVVRVVVCAVVQLLTTDRTMSFRGEEDGDGATDAMRELEANTLANAQMTGGSSEEDEMEVEVVSGGPSPVVRSPTLSSIRSNEPLAPSVLPASSSMQSSAAGAGAHVGGPVSSSSTSSKGSRTRPPRRTRSSRSPPQKQQRGKARGQKSARKTKKKAAMPHSASSSDLRRVDSLRLAWAVPPEDAP